MMRPPIIFAKIQLYSNNYIKNTTKYIRNIKIVFIVLIVFLFVAVYRLPYISS